MTTKKNKNKIPSLTRYVSWQTPHAQISNDSSFDSSFKKTSLYRFSTTFQKTKFWKIFPGRVNTTGVQTEKIYKGMILGASSGYLKGTWVLSLQKPLLTPLIDNNWKAMSIRFFETPKASVADFAFVKCEKKRTYFSETEKPICDKDALT